MQIRRESLNNRTAAAPDVYNRSEYTSGECCPLLAAYT